MVSQGPFYICTCCDQLWYKHSDQANKLRQQNPDILKYLIDEKKGLVTLNGYVQHTIAI